MFPWAQKNTMCVALAASQPTKGRFLVDVLHAHTSLPWLGGGQGALAEAGLGLGGGRSSLLLRTEDKEVCFRPAGMSSSPTSLLWKTARNSGQ